MHVGMPETRLASFQDVLCCPECRGSLTEVSGGLACPSCRREYPLTHHVPRFSTLSGTTSDAQFQQQEMRNETYFAKAYNLGKRLVSSEYAARNQLRDFLTTIPKGKRLLELGSGSRRVHADAINIDLFAFPNVDVVADIRRLPIRDASIDYVVLDTVLEHVAEPELIVAEIHRVLVPGGRVLCIAPFIFPYHGYPAHYWNFSKDGLTWIFRNFSNCTVETNMGPTSAMTHLTSEYFAVALSGGAENKVLYTLFKGIFLMPIFLLKYLDRFWVRSQHAHRLASTLSALATK